MYPNLIRETDHIDPTQLAEQPKLDLYAISYIAIQSGITYHWAHYVVASSRAQAHFLAIEEAKDNFPECEGYLCHHAHVILIQGEQLAKAGYSRD
jgi:hypothetical protein